MSRTENGPAKPLSGRRVVFVVAPLEYRDEELNEPKKRLEEGGARTAIASTAIGTCKGMLGGSVQATLATKDLDAEQWDSVAVVGGMGSPDSLWEDAPLHAFLRKMNAAGKPIGAICLSGAVLAKSGILRGRRATVWPDPKAIDVMTSEGAIYEKAPIVEDGQIITGEGPHAAVEFGEKLADALTPAPAHR